MGLGATLDGSVDVRSVKKFSLESFKFTDLQRAKLITELHFSERSYTGMYEGNDDDQVFVSPRLNVTESDVNACESELVKPDGFLENRAKAYMHYVDSRGGDDIILVEAAPITIILTVILLPKL